MKVLGTILAAGMVLASSAHATTVLVSCGGFAVPPNPASSSITCPGITGLGPISNFSESVLISSDFSGGALGMTNSSEAQFTSTVAGFTTDTLTASGNPNSSSYTDTAGLTQYSTPNFFIDPTTLTQGGAASSFTVNYSSADDGGTAPGASGPTVGNVQAATGQVYELFSYTTTPEPATLSLLGAGLLGLGFLGHRRRVRK